MKVNMLNKQESYKIPKGVDRILKHKDFFTETRESDLLSERSRRVMTRIIDIIDLIEEFSHEGLICPKTQSDFSFQRFKAKQFPRKEKYISRMFEKALKLRKALLPSDLGLTIDGLILSDKSLMSKLRRPKVFTRLDDFQIAKLDKFINYVCNFGVRHRVIDESNINKAMEDLPKNTSSCFPVYKKKSSKEAIDQAFISLGELISKDQKGMMEMFIVNPITIFHRFTPKIRNLEESNFQSCNLEVKKRVVQGVPFMTTLVEHILFNDTFKSITSNSNYLSYSNKRIDTSEETLEVRSNCDFEKEQIICGDFDSFDANISPQFILIILATLCEASEINESVEYLISQVHIINFIFSPLIGAIGFNYTEGGHITGCYLTSLFASLSTLLILTLTDKNEEMIDERKLKILGDDFIIASSQHMEDYILGFSEHGFKMNASKVRVSKTRTDPIRYLGFDWDENGEPNIGPNWVVARCCYPERFVDIPDKIRTYQRVCSIIFQIKDGPMWFEETLLKYDNYFISCVHKKQDPIIRYIDKNDQPYNFKVPLSKLLAFGWKIL